MKKSYISLFGIILLFSILIASPAAGLAQTAPPFSLEPMNDHFQLTSGGTYQGSFTVTNEGDEARNMQIALTNFTLTEGGSFKALTGEGSTDHSLSDYVTFSPSSAELGPGETVEVQYSVDLPENVTPKPRWASLIVTSKEAAQTTEEGSDAMTFQVNLNFSYIFALFQRSGEAKQLSGRIGTIDAKSDGESLTVEAPFYNEGQSIAETDGYVEVRNASGESVLRYEFSADQLVLPESKRIFSHTFQNPDLDPGNYLVVAALDYGADSMLAGQAMLQVG